jgi:hypothetical protein
MTQEDNMKKIPMKMVEYQHRNEGGGNMVQLPNEIFDHGEVVLIVSRSEFLDLIETARAAIEGVRGTGILEKLRAVVKQIATL